MKLLDAADVERGNGTWYAGWEGDSRACGVEVELVDSCDPDDNGDLVGDENSAPGTYTTLPFATVAKLRRPVNCLRDDDEQWLTDALKAAEEYAVSRALVVEAVPGTESWVGGDQVKEVPYTAADPLDEAALETAIVDARELWFSTVLSTDGAPILHVSPRVAPTLVRAGILQITADGPYSIWDDKVVIAPGYTTESPSVFFTGPIKVYLSTVDTMGLLVGNRNNRTEISANFIAVLDVDPCTIVRVGGVAAGSFKPTISIVSTDELTVVALALNTPDGEPVTYDWGDGTPPEQIADDANATHTYAASGTYTIKISTTDGGTASRQVTVVAAPVPATGATAGIPGTWTPAGSIPPATVADLQGGIPNAVVASPTTGWTTGQHVQTQTAGAAGRATWTGTGWVGGLAPLEAEAAASASS